MFSSISSLKGERKILQMNNCLQLWCRWELYNFWSYEPSYLNERQLVQDGFHFTCVLVKYGKLDYLFIITDIVLASFLHQSFSTLAAWRYVDLHDDWRIVEVKVLYTHLQLVMVGKHFSRFCAINCFLKVPTQQNITIANNNMSLDIL